MFLKRNQQYGTDRLDRQRVSCPQLLGRSMKLEKGLMLTLREKQGQEAGPSGPPTQPLQLRKILYLMSACRVSARVSNRPTPAAVQKVKGQPRLHRIQFPVLSTKTADRRKATTWTTCLRSMKGKFQRMMISAILGVRSERTPRLRPFWQE